MRSQRSHKDRMMKTMPVVPDLGENVEDHVPDLGGNVEEDQVLHD